LEGDGAGCATFLRDANAVLSAFDEPPLPFRLVAINNRCGQRRTSRGCTPADVSDDKVKAWREGGRGPRSGGS
jgi:hypothetical protein